MRYKVISGLVLLGALLAPIVAAAGWGDFDYKFDNDKPWKELRAKLPPPPVAKNQLPFAVSPATDNKFYVDAPSISIGKDGVIRYTLVIQSPSGARNVTFEGMRCRTEEYKVYAYGRDNGAWDKAQGGKWRPIRYHDLNRPRHVLYDDFFCPRQILVRSAAQAIQALKYPASHDPSMMF